MEDVSFQPGKVSERIAQSIDVKNSEVIPYVYC